MTSDSLDESLNILIIDDDPDYHYIIGKYAKNLGHTWAAAANLEQAEQALEDAEKAGTPFSIATIDMRFEVGKKGIESPLGRDILRSIKSKYPYIACIMVTGSPEVAPELLKYRDKYGLDSFIAKDRLSEEVLAEEIAWAIGRVRLEESRKEVHSVSKSFPESAVLAIPSSQSPVAAQEKPTTRPSVFISYNHKDEGEKERLLLHLGVLHDVIDLWSDDRIEAGADWEAEIVKAIAHAKVAILLITANFLTSDFILGKEIPSLLGEHKHKGLIVFPVIARACAWRRVDWLRRINVRPKNGRPVWSDAGSHIDEDLAAIAEEVAAIIEAKT